MRLAWGHRAGLHGATASQNAAFVFVLLWAMLAGGLVPRPLPVNAITPQSRAEIEEALSLLRFANERGDRFWLEFVVDQQRPLLVACFRQLFTSPGRLDELLPLQLVSLEQHLDAYARGRVMERDGPRTYFFRRIARVRVISPIIQQTTWRWHLSVPPRVPAGITPPTRCA